MRALIDFSECLEIFPSANSTERRQFVVHKLSHFNCDCPNINFTSATAFRTHMTSVHSDKKNLSLRYSTHHSYQILKNFEFWLWKQNLNTVFLLCQFNIFFLCAAKKKKSLPTWLCFAWNKMLRIQSTSFWNPENTNMLTNLEKSILYCNFR